MIVNVIVFTLMYTFMSVRHGNLRHVIIILFANYLCVTLRHLCTITAAMTRIAHEYPFDILESCFSSCVVNSKNIRKMVTNSVK